MVANDILEARIERALRVAERIGMTVYGFRVRPNEIEILTQPFTAGEPLVIDEKKRNVDDYFKSQGA